MVLTPSSPELVLATDLDGTFLGGDHEHRSALYGWIAANRHRISLWFVTGRDLDFIGELCADGWVPSPDVVVGDVGTTVVDADFTPIPEVEAEIARRWGDRGDEVRRALADVEGLELQPTPFRHRVSYYYDPARLDPAVLDRVRDMGLDPLLSADTYFDVLPPGVSKGPTLRHLVEHLGVDPDRVVVAGDTMNDRSLFETGFHAVAVGGSEPALLAELDALRADGRVTDERLHRADAHGAGGIAEAVARWFPHLDPPAPATAASSTTLAGQAGGRPDPSSNGDSPRSDLVIVYHRQPYEEVEVDGEIEYRENSSPNGIVPSLKSFFGHVDHGAWVAWKQVAEAVEPGDEPFPRVVTIDDSFGEYDVSRLALTEEQVTSFYHVTSKEALWPILHSFPSNYDYDPIDWPTFRDVNERFALAAAEQVTDDGLVWVHDYNLWLVPLYLRRLKPDVRIAFFHHTPFPSSDVFNVLPWRAEIVESLLSCDLVGFHIPRYAANFVSVARSHLPIEVREAVAVEDGLSPHGMALSEPTVPTVIATADREIAIDAFPIGTNVEYIEEIASRGDTAGRVREIRRELGDRQLIVSVARTDYTKGTREMLEAYGRLLERRPELITKVTLMVISVYANSNMTAYQQAQEEIEGLVGRINGQHAEFGWQPIILFSTATPFEELISYYRAADVCWITPLRDGLNLVAKEFVASRTDDTGVLVLSEFAGTAVELPDAVLANPNSHRSMDRSIDEALDMPLDEQIRRMRALRRSVRRFDIGHWAQHTQERFAQLVRDRSLIPG